MAKQNKKQTLSKMPTDEQLQGNQHDKIIKESIEETMLFMLKTFAGLDVVKSENLPTEIQQTQERKPDFLKLITDRTGIERIGHLEFHVKDEADISYRAFETCAMMKRKRPQSRILQIIVYMGEKPAENIITEISDDHYRYRLQLIQFIKTPVEVFLNSDSPAEVLLGVLSDFGDQSAEIILPQLVEKVVIHAKTDLERLKFLQHLRIFSKLRNFGPLINQIMENTIAYFGLKDEDDYMYKRGEKKAEARFLKESAAQKADAERQKADAERQKADAERQKAEAERRIKESQIREKEIRKHLEQTQRFTVVQLLDAATLTEYQIIKVFGVTDAFVQSVKKDLAAAPKKIEQLKTKMTAEEIAQTLNLPINWIEKQLE